MEQGTATVPGWKTYHRLTRTATYGFVSVLPLLVLYEVMILIANRGDIYQVRVGAEVWIKRLLASVGLSGILALGVLVLLAGVAVAFYERHRSIPLRPRYFGWLIVESAGYAVLVAFAVSRLVGLLLSAWAAGGAGPVADTWTMLALSIGAGLYEELLFRVLLVGGLYLVLKRLGLRGAPAYGLAAVAGALVFSAAHYLGPLGDPFTMASFLFRFLFGLALNALFLVRGFGVAAWTHALYDVMVVTHLLG
ncbi:CPBP family intramembrane metalloprotease [Rhodocaloribacter litoris]|nr:CPBP family intramembrane metalloprotease [Rhodocaloribacter litoris]GIV60994.1 MAG: CAAX amino protease [Rhodothermaceae bacterium]